MSYDSLERSVQDAAPDELYEFQSPTNFWRYADAREKVTYGGFDFTPAVIKRSAYGSTTTANRRQFTVTVPYDLDVVRSNSFSVIPPEYLHLTFYRLLGGLAIQPWAGYITSIALEGRWAKMQVLDVIGAGFKTQVPSVGYHAPCTHQLYGTRCAVANSSHALTTTVTAMGSTTQLTLASVGGHADQWYRAGYVMMPASGEQRDILDQTGNVITIDAPFRSIIVGSSVTVYDGCDHNVITCFNKFNNVANFGGTPYVPILNMFRGQLRSKV